jgi:hypothetical protein
MLKCKRVVLGPKRPSRYGKLRREPRSDGLATIEAAAMLLARLERRPEIETALNASFERLLARYRETSAVSGARAFSGKVDTDLGSTRDRHSISPKSATADLGGFPQKMRPSKRGR